MLVIAALSAAITSAPVDSVAALATLSIPVRPEIFANVNASSSGTTLVLTNSAARFPNTTLAVSSFVMLLTLKDLPLS